MLTRSLTSIALCLLAIGPLARGVSAAPIATVDVEQLEQKSVVYKRLNESLDKLGAQFQAELEARKGFKYLAPEDAEKAAAIYARSMRREKLSEAETKSLADLTAKDRALGDEWIQLVKIKDPNEEQRRRVDELTRWQRGNREAFDALQKSLSERMNERRDKLADVLDKTLNSSIEKACKEVAAESCLVSVITMYQPSPQSPTTLKKTPVRVVHWGGSDVTARVIALLDEVNVDKEIAALLPEPGRRVVTVTHAPTPTDLLDAKDKDYHMRLVASSATALPMLIATLATAQAAQAQSVAYIDYYAIVQQAKPYQDSNQQLEALMSDRSAEYLIANSILYLSADEAKIATELSLRQMRDQGQGLSDAEQTQLKTLLDKDRAASNEHAVLVQRADLAANEKARRDELGKLRSERQDAIKALATTNMNELESKSAEIEKGLQDQLRAAIEKVSQRIGAAICLQKWIIVFEPQENGELKPMPINLVHWGGTDVTKDVLALLNGEAAPPQ